MASSHAVIRTQKPGRYLAQLCKHFSHRLAASWNEASGCIEFPSGTCSLSASDGRLDIDVEVPDDSNLLRLEQVVEKHLERFAFREPLQIAWVRPQPQSISLRVR